MAFIGSIDNTNVLLVELHALLRGLCIVIASNFKMLDIAMDSQVVIEIVLKRNECPWQAMTLVSKIHHLLHDIDFFIRHCWWKIFLCKHASAMLGQTSFSPLTPNDDLNRETNCCSGPSNQPPNKKRSSDYERESSSLYEFVLPLDQRLFLNQIS